MKLNLHFFPPSFTVLYLCRTLYYLLLLHSIASLFNSKNPMHLQTFLEVFFGYNNIVNIWLFPDDSFNLKICYNRIILLILSNSKERGLSLNLLPTTLQLSSCKLLFLPSMPYAICSWYLCSLGNISLCWQGHANSKSS